MALGGHVERSLEVVHQAVWRPELEAGEPHRKRVGRQGRERRLAERPVRENVPR